MSSNESYSSHDEILISIKEEVANNIDSKLTTQLYHLRFGYSVGTTDFGGRFGADEVNTIRRVERFLSKHRIEYTRKLIKANLDTYVSNT